MSDEEIWAEYTLEQLLDFKFKLDHRIELLRVERAEEDLEKLKDVIWGECTCGHVFTEYDKLHMSYCPGCGAPLRKDE